MKNLTFHDGGKLLYNLDCVWILVLNFSGEKILLYGGHKLNFLFPTSDLEKLLLCFIFLFPSVLVFKESKNFFENCKCVSGT